MLALGQRPEVSFDKSVLPPVTGMDSGAGGGGVKGFLGKIGSFFKGFADGGDVTPYLGRRVRFGERGPEAVVDSQGNVQLVGLSGPETGVPVHPAVVIPTEMLSGAGLALSGQSETAGRASDARDLIPPGGLRYEHLLSAVRSLSDGGAQTATPQRPPVVYPALPQTPDPASLPIPASVGTVGSPAPSVAPAASVLPQSRYVMPGLVTTGDERGDLGRYENDLEGWRNPADRNGRVKSGLKGAALGFVRGLATGGLAGGVGGAATGLAYGVAVPNWDERAARDAEIARVGGRINLLDQRAKEEAQTGEIQAQTDWMKARPAIEQGKADAQTLARAQQGLQREIGNRLKEPRPFDATDPYDSDLAQRAQAAGVSFDPQSFGDFKNPAQMEVVDPSDPSGTKKTRLVLDRASGLWQPVTVNGQDVTTGYATPVGPDGMTASQRGNLQLGQDRFNETQKQNAVRNDFERARINLAGRRFDLSSAQFDNRLGEQTRRELKAANDLAARSEMYARAANDLSSKTTFVDPNDGQVKESKKWAARRDEYLAKAAEGRRQFVDNYGYLFAPSDGAAPQMTLDQFRGLFPNAAGSPAVEASRLGVTLSDTDQGVRAPSSPMPRRSAPMRVGGRGSTPSPAQSKGNVSRAKFRQKYPQYQNSTDSNVDAAISAAGYTPIP